MQPCIAAVLLHSVARIICLTIFLSCALVAKTTALKKQQQNKQTGKRSWNDSHYPWYPNTKMAAFSSPSLIVRTIF